MNMLDRFKIFQIFKLPGEAPEEQLAEYYGLKRRESHRDQTIDELSRSFEEK